MSTLIAIDPGRATGLAIFHCAKLTHAMKTSVHDRDHWPRMFAMANEMVIERPQVYKLDKQKGDPNDLITLALEAGRWIERASLSNVPHKVFLPNEWKGQVPKPIHHKRALSKLDATELALLPTCRVSKDNPHGYDNNMLDAVALGLWYLQRLR